MKAAPTAVVNFLAAQQAAPASDMGFVELYTITLQNGTVLRWSSADIPLVSGGNTWVANGPQIDGLKFHSTLGLDVDQQEISISVNYASAAGVPTVGGLPFMTALSLGLFDLAVIQRDRAVFSGTVGGTIVVANLIGIIPALYKGRFIEVKPGRLQAKITVANSLVVLQQQMPRRTFAPTCQHVFGDSFCAVNQIANTTVGSCLSGSTTTVIKTAAAALNQIGGTLTFTSGANNGSSSTITACVPGVSLTVSPAFGSAAALNDTFLISQTGNTRWSGICGTGSTTTVIHTTTSFNGQVVGTLKFTSGLNNGSSSTITAANPGVSLTVSPAFAHAAASSDTFIVTRPNSATGAAGAGSTQQAILTSIALFLHAGGTLTWTSGANNGIQGTVARSSIGSTLWMQYPFPEPVNTGDTFVVTLGCDHTEAMCVNSYNNLQNFLGFPQVPPPQSATG